MGVALIQDRGRLVAALRARGVDYLMPEDAQGAPVDEAALIASLAANEDPRLRQALIALFMLEPRLAEHVPAVEAQLDGPARLELIAHYMAAVYLRQIWATRLRQYIPPSVPLADLYSKRLALPSPTTNHGELGLRALANWHASHGNDRGSHLAEYENAADLLFGRLVLKAHAHVHAAAR